MSKGRITVICGPMFSGKTSELHRILKRVKIAERKFLLFKPAVDNRYSEDEVVSHDQVAFNSYSVEKASDIIDVFFKHENVHTVAIDEAQFFKKSGEKNIVYVCKFLKKRGINVVVNGLDMDYQGEAFGPMPELMAVSDSILKLKAVCKHNGCGEDAEMTMKIKSSEEKELDDGQFIELGETEKYEPRCYKHWSPSKIFESGE